MTASYLAQYLVFAYKFGSCKITCFDHIDRHVGPSSRRGCSCNLQRMAKLSSPQNQEICGHG